jgi:hypothetical protein
MKQVLLGHHNLIRMMLTHCLPVPQKQRQENAMVECLLHKNSLKMSSEQSVLVSISWYYLGKFHSLHDRVWNIFLSKCKLLLSSHHVGNLWSQHTSLKFQSDEWLCEGPYLLAQQWSIQWNFFDHIPRNQLYTLCYFFLHGRMLFLFSQTASESTFFWFST